MDPTPESMADSGSDLLVSLSGGKDSTATYLHLLESGYLDRVERGGGTVYRVFADTGWELPETYEYIEKMEDLLGKRIVRLTAIYEKQAAKKDRNPFEFWLNEQYGGFLAGTRVSAQNVPKVKVANSARARIGRMMKTPSASSRRVARK